MNKLITFAVALLLGTTLYANEDTDICLTVAELAYEIMVARQQGIDMADIYAGNDISHPVVEHIVIEAYKQPIQETTEDKVAMVKAYTAWNYRECMIAQSTGS